MHKYPDDDDDDLTEGFSQGPEKSCTDNETETESQTVEETQSLNNSDVQGPTKKSRLQ